jgi:hypothetical protein
MWFPGVFRVPFIERRVGRVWMGFPHTLFFTSELTKNPDITNGEFRLRSEL